MTQIEDPTLFLEKFRISIPAFEYILKQIGVSLLHQTARNNALSPPHQLMIAFLGNGGQYHGIGDMHGIHKSTVHRALKRVCTSIIEIMLP
jgi:DNA-binding MarR family transcriptional regulator